MPACLAARANCSVPSRFTEYVAAGLRLPSGSLDSAARQSTASYPARSAAMPFRMSSVALVPASGSAGPRSHPSYRPTSSPSTSCPAARRKGTRTAPMYPRSPATRTLMDYSQGSTVRREAVCRLIYEPRRARRDTWGGTLFA